MFELVALYRVGSELGKKTGFLFERKEGPVHGDWERARLAARRIMTAPDSPYKPLRVRICRAKARKP
jgi:hypothetical protein